MKLHAEKPLQGRKQTSRIIRKSTSSSRVYEGERSFISVGACKCCTDIVLQPLCSEKRKTYILSKRIFILMVRQTLLCFSGCLCCRTIQWVRVSCGLAAASIILSFRKHFSVVILATWAHCGLMSASEHIISIFSSLKFSQLIWLCLLCVCFCLCLCRSVGMFSHT